MKSYMSKLILKEGFSVVIIILLFDVVCEVVKLFGVILLFLKFFCIQYFINFGVVILDDLVLNLVFYFIGFVVIEEKIDGVNMGILLDYNGLFVLQNWSYIINL